jgi:hypothetical protein
VTAEEYDDALRRLGELAAQDHDRLMVEADRLREAMRAALEAFQLRGENDHPLRAIGRAAMILTGALG